MKTLATSFQVEYRYKVFFTESLFGKNNTYFQDFLGDYEEPAHKRKILFVVDEQVLRLHNYLQEDIPRYFSGNKHAEIVSDLLVLPGGETVKNESRYAEQVIEAIHRNGIDRHSFVAAIGGGALLDLAGYAAAVSHRGVRHIRIPTTVLSQNDSGVGVKNAVNFRGKKNFIGTFSPPVAVFNDYRFLETLDGRDWRSGLAEAVKVALVKDADFFDWIEANASLLAKRDRQAIEYLVYRCAQLHVQHIAGADPFERGTSRPLDFGHWLAHKLEQLSGFSIRHGEAVAIGMAIDSMYANKCGLLPPGDLDRILALLLELDFDLFHPVLLEKEKQAIEEGLKDFREHLGGRLTLMLPERIGKGKEVHTMDIPRVREAINAIRSTCLINSFK